MSATANFIPIPRDSPLARLLSRHDAGHGGFLTHLDRSPIFAKRNVFLNQLAICLGLWTLFAGLVFTTYLDLSSRSSISFWAVFQAFSISAAIYALLLPITLPFFLGEFRVRLLYGFRSAEIVIRQPTGTRNLPNRTLSDEEHLSEWLSTKHAMDPKFLYNIPGALTGVDFWELSYDAILDAYDQMCHGEIHESQLELGMWKEEDGVWGVWDVGGVRDNASMEPEVALFLGSLEKERSNDGPYELHHQVPPAMITEQHDYENMCKYVAELFMGVNPP